MLIFKVRVCVSVCNKSQPSPYSTFGSGGAIPEQVYIASTSANERPPPHAGGFTATGVALAVVVVTAETEDASVVFLMDSFSLEEPFFLFSFV